MRGARFSWPSHAWATKIVPRTHQPFTRTAPTTDRRAGILLWIDPAQRWVYGCAVILSSIFARAGSHAERFVRRWMPDPFVLVLLLSLVALVLGYLAVAGLTLNGDVASTLVMTWTGGFGNAEILKFGLQIILIVVTGEAIAASPPARRLLARLTNVPKTPAQALLLVTSFALARSVARSPHAASPSITRSSVPAPTLRCCSGTPA